MLEIKNTKITNYEDEQKARGTGQLKSRRELNTKNFYDKMYNKFKTNNQLYLDDKMWTTAATRGELDNLIYLLNENKTENEGLEAIKSWGMGVDYDTYMLALSIPTLNNEEKKTRLNDKGDYSFGDLTDQEWAKMVLEATNNKYQADYIEANKENLEWWQKAGAGIVSFVGHIATGIVGAAQNAFNLGEGIYNFVTGGDFLEAWADDDDEFLANVYEQMKYAMWELDRVIMPWVDAVKANEEGYTTMAGNIELGSKAFTEGIKQIGYGGGLTTWGRWWQSGLQSFGEMLPFMVAPAVNISKFPKFSKAATKVIKTGGFYTTNVFSANIGDTVKTAQLNGISYKDLNAGKVIGNAALKTVGQYMIEVLLGKVLGFTGLDAMMGVGDDVVGAAKWFTKAASTTGAKAAGVALGRGALSMVKEGLEEVLQDMSDNMIDMFFGGDYAERAKENLTWQNIGDAFVVGALTSGVIGTLSSASVVINRNTRTIAIDEKTGKAYRMGLFQQLNYNQAMQAMAGWQETLNDKNASIQDKADAAFRLNGVVSTIGNVLKTFGTERSQKALELLTIYQNKRSTAEEKVTAKAQLSDSEFAKSLFNDYVEANKQAIKKFKTQKDQDKLKKALEKEAKLLKKNGVTKITDIVTQELSTDDPDTDIPVQSAKAVKQLLKETKSDMVVAIDGKTVVKSDDVIFAPESLVKEGKISEILEGIAYDKAIKIIGPELSKKQNELILEEFKKLSGRQDTTIDDALVALLFDKSFYTYILLKTNETQSINDANDAIKILAIMDSIVKGKIAGDVDKGTLTQAAYQKLVERIQENMRAGLVVYAVNYTNIDLDAVSSEILPASYKELIRTNKNVIFTKAVNDCMESKQRGVITQNRIAEFDKQIDKFIGLNAAFDEMIVEAKQKIRSAEYNDRFDACALLRYLTTIQENVQLIFLRPDNPNGTIDTNDKNIILVTEFFDVEWNKLINGEFELTDLSEDAQAYIKEAGYDISNYNDRIAMLRERLYHYSNNTLTISNNGEVLQIIDKNKLVKKEYLTKDGDKKLLADIKSGKVKYVKDICKITINKTIGNLKIVLDESLDYNGFFDDTSPKQITISKSNIVNTIMHESTHATQYYTRSKQSERYTSGGNVTVLSKMPGSILDEIDDYLAKNFPLIYRAMLIDTNNDIPEIIYFNIEGEMQAMCKLTNLLFETGFTWSNNKQTLHSPDGKKSWNLKLKTDKITVSTESDIDTREQVSEDRPLKRAEANALKDDKKIQQFIKDSYFKNEDGTPIIFYRLSTKRDSLKKAKFFSTEPAFDVDYHVRERDTLRGYVVNISKNDLIEIDVKGDSWSELYIDIDDANIETVDDLVNYWYDKINTDAEFSNIKGLYIKNIYEGASSAILTNDLVIFDESTVMRVTKNDNGKFVEEFWNSSGPKINKPKYSKDYINELSEKYANVSDKVRKYVITDNNSVINQINNITVYKGVTTKKLPDENFDNLKGDKKRIIPGSIWFTDNKNVAETYADLQTGEVIETRIEIHNPLVIDAQGRYFSNVVPGMTTDDIVKQAKSAGYDSVIFKNIVDVGPRLLNSTNRKNTTIPSTDIIVFDNNQVKGTSQISESRKISNKIAEQSNLKYFIKKGQQIQLDERVQQFVINTTDDFDKLEPVIQKAIKAGTMTLLDLQNYVETANSMNDYTFKKIAKYIYENEEVAKLTYKEMIKILENLEEIDALKLFLNKSELIDKKMSYTKMLNAYTKIKEDSKTNKKIAEALAGYTNLAGTIKPDGSRQFIPYEADIDQLHGAFFRHYHGTIRSVSGLNNLGKNIAHNQEALSLSENEGEGANLKSRKSGTWNWIDRMRKADINYGNVEQLSETLNDIDRQDKINFIQEHIVQSIIEQSKINNWSREQVLEEFNSQRDRLDDLSDNEIDKLYMAATSEGIIETTPDYMNIKTELEKRYVRKGTKEYKGKYASRIMARATAKQAGRRVAQKLAGMKTRYNMLLPEVQELFDRKADGHYELNTKYQDMSDADLETIIPKLQEANKQLAERIRFVEAAKKSKLNAIKRANRQAEKMLDKQIGEGKKTIREKVDIVHKVVLKQEEFDIVSREKAPNAVEQLLATSWDKTRTTTVQGLNNNIEQNVANAETFYAVNSDTFMNMSVAEAEQTARWFIDAKMTGTMTPQDFKKFGTVQTLTLGYILSETRENGQFAGLSANLKNKISEFMRDDISLGATKMSLWNGILKRLNPLEVMMSQSVVIGGVELTESEQRELFTAAQQGDMETVAKLQQRTLERIKKEAGTKKKFLRRVTAVRSMSMLSSPLTWLRNIVSNFMLKRLNKWSSVIGNKVFTNKGKSGQLKFTGNITPEIQKFINDNFIDNKLFETLVSNISKYNPSEVSKKFKNKDGSIDKNAILANMVIKSMYGQYYSENMFKSNFMNKTYQGLMKMMSDNNYVREAAIRYFGKILADKGTDLSKGVTDQIMTDFANAIGIAMADYMHSNNFFNNLERIAADHGELTLFLYKNLLPFMSTSWNWFKAGIRYSPIGLVNSIIKLTRIENVVRKQTSKWKHGEAQVAPEYTEYLIRRDIGSGVIGTMAFGVGILLAALGWIDLDDDDYGVPKLIVGDLEVDISSIFGTSSVLAGAALIVDIRDQGLSWNTVLSGLDNMLDVYADGFFLTELMALDMYAGGGSFATALDWAESFGLSFIPNGLAWLAGMTYTGTLRKRGFFGKAAAKVPFLAGLVNEKKVDPYTGETGNIWDVFNRVFPYVDIKMKSRAKETAEFLGLSKSELRGQYTINNEEFNLSDKEVSEINKQYGEWNAKDLTAFLDDKERYKVKDNTTGNYKMLTYSQMTDKQRKNTISTIMENNAENAKILAWLNAGYKYYASANKYAELRQLGIKRKLYKGSKGFAKE